MIVLEGPDGSGKTTLLGKLIAHYGFAKSERAMSAQQKPLKAMDAYISDTLQQGFQHKFFDRFALISGPIYAPIMNDLYQLNIYSNLEWMSRHINWFYRECRPIVIYCLPPVHVVRDNVRDDPENATVAEYTERIYQAYVNRAAIDMAYGRTMIYSYVDDDGEGFNNMTRAINRILHQEQTGKIGWR